MRDRNTGTQPNFQKTLSKCGILSPKKTVVLTFLRCVSIKFAAVSNNDVTPTSDTPSLGLKQHKY